MNIERPEFAPCCLYMLEIKTGLLLFTVADCAETQVQSINESHSAAYESVDSDVHALKRRVNAVEHAQSHSPSTDELHSLEQRLVHRATEEASASISEAELAQHLRRLLTAAHSSAIAQGDETSENTIAALFEALPSSSFSASFANREAFTTPYSQRQRTRSSEISRLQSELSDAQREIRKLRDEMNVLKAENAGMRKGLDDKHSTDSLSDAQAASAMHMSRLEERVNRLESCAELQFALYCSL